MRRQRVKTWIAAALALAIVGAGGWYVAAHRDDFAVLGRLETGSLLGILAAMVALLAMGGTLFNVFLRRYGVALTWHRGFGLYMMQSVGNILMPLRGGSGLAAAYLRAAEGLALTRFALALAGTYVAAAAVNALLALAGMALVAAAGGPVGATPVAGALAVLAAAAATMVLPAPAPSERWGWRHAVRLLRGWNELVRDRPLLAKVLALALGQGLVQAAALWLIYRALGLEVGPAAALAISSMGTIASMIALLPASLGPFDAVMVALPAAWGLTVAEAMAALVVFRAAVLAATFALAGAFALALRPAKRSGK